VGESSEEIRETQLLVLEDPDRYSRESGMENLDLSVEIHRNSEDVGVLGYFDRWRNVVRLDARTVLRVDANAGRSPPHPILRRRR